MSTNTTSCQVELFPEEPEESLIERLLRLLANPETGAMLERTNKVLREETKRLEHNQQRRSNRIATKAERQELLDAQKMVRREEEQILLSTFPTIVDRFQEAHRQDKR